MGGGFTVAQVAWVVDDLDAAMRRWREAVNAGPFFVIPHSRVRDGTYRGRPITMNLSLAMGQMGSVQLELIDQHDSTSSPYRDSVPRGTSALHHIGGFTDDLDAEIGRYQALGVDLVYSGSVGDMRFAYVDTRPSLGCMTEVLERGPRIEAMFARVRQSSVGWDGSDPVRSYLALDQEVA